VFTGPEEETPADEVPGGGTLTVDAHSAVVLQAAEGG
jgi:glycogen operon protein